MKNIESKYGNKMKNRYSHKIITRINNYTLCNAPKNLPTKEILITEWWVSK